MYRGHLRNDKRRDRRYGTFETQYMEGMEPMKYIESQQYHSSDDYRLYDEDIK